MEEMEALYTYIIHPTYRIVVLMEP